MPGLTPIGGAPIGGSGSAAVAAMAWCGCCGSCGEETRTYEYFDTVPPAPAFIECPNVSDCNGVFIITWYFGGLIPNRIGGAGPGDCAGDTLNCYVRSVDFPIGCTSPQATVYAGSGLDDYGTISGPSDTITVADPCPGTGLGTVATTTTITPYVVDNGNGTQYLKLNVAVTNSPTVGGPYGVASLSVRWWFA